MQRTRSLEPRMPSVHDTEAELAGTAGSAPATRPPALAGLLWAALPGLRWSLVVYLVSRVPVVAGLLVFWARNPKEDLTTTALRQDGWWYVRIAEQGYGASLRPVLPGSVYDYHHSFSEWAFFPGYPLVIRGVHAVTFLPYLDAAIVVAAVFGLLAVWAVYTLGASFGGAGVGQASALLLAAWPGSGAFTLPYSEGMFVTAAAVTLLYLHRERWVPAGVAGAVATATRPSGVALVAAAAAVAVVHLVRHRRLRPMLAPLLSLTGIAGFVLYGWLRTGDALVWRHAENLWNQRLDLSKTLVEHSAPVLANPAEAMQAEASRLLLAHAVLDVAGAAVLLAMAAAAVRLRRRLSLAWVVYALVSAALIVAYSAVAPRPRTVLVVLPGFVWLAAWMPRRVLYGVSAAFLVAMPFVVYLWSWRVTP